MMSRMDCYLGHIGFQVVQSQRDVAGLAPSWKDNRLTKNACDANERSLTAIGSNHAILVSPHRKVIE